MNLEEYPTFFESFYFVRQNNCQFELDANIENIATYFKFILEKSDTIHAMNLCRDPQSFLMYRCRKSPGVFL